MSEPGSAAPGEGAPSMQHAPGARAARGPARRTLSPAAAERLRLRYPRSRLPRGGWVVAVTLGTTIAIGWLIWAAWVHANPAATAQVTAYAVRDDTTIVATLTVGRPDPSVPATCRVVAQAADFQTVGEQQVLVPAGQFELTNIEVVVTTLRAAVSASSRGCESQR